MAYQVNFVTTPSTSKFKLIIWHTQLTLYLHQVRLNSNSLYDTYSWRNYLSILRGIYKKHDVCNNIETILFKNLNSL